MATMGERPLHVQDAPARETREVMVLAGVPIEAGVGAGQLLDQALGDEQPEVPVHRAQAHARQAPPDQSVHGLRRRV